MTESGWYWQKRSMEENRKSKQRPTELWPTGLYKDTYFGCSGSPLLHMGFLQLSSTGFSLQWPLLLQSTDLSVHGLQWLLPMGSVVCILWAPGLRLSSCGAHAQLLPSIQDLPGPGIEQVFPALQGEFLTSGPPGKPWPTDFCQKVQRKFNGSKGTFSKNSAGVTGDTEAKELNLNLYHY